MLTAHSVVFASSPPRTSVFVVPKTTNKPQTDSLLIEQDDLEQAITFDEPSSLSLPMASSKVLFIAPHLAELKQIFQILLANDLQPFHKERLPELPLVADSFQHVFIDLSVDGALDWLRAATQADTELSPIALIQRGEREGSALAAGAIATLQHPVDAADVLLCIERNRVRLARQRHQQESMDRDRRRIATHSVEVVLMTLCQELRNPLAAALANVEYLRDTDHRASVRVAAEEKRNILEDTFEALQRVRVALDGFATLVKREITEPRRVAFWQVVQGVLDELGHDSSYVSLSGDPTVRGWADDELLREVVSTLLRRSINAASGESNVPAIRIRVYGTETEARISLRDNGPALTAEMVANLFDRTDISSGRGSTGLLLAVTHHALVRMGGALEYAPRSSQGGLFRIRLRLVRSTE